MPLLDSDDLARAAAVHGKKSAKYGLDKGASCPFIPGTYFEECWHDGYEIGAAQQEEPQNDR